MRRAHLLIVLLAALLLRVLYLNQVAALPFFDQPFGDSAVHVLRAAEIRQGSFLPDRPLFYGSPLYPYFLAAVLSIPRGGYYLVCFIQIFAGVLGIYLVSRAARRLSGRRAGAAAAIIGALYGPFAFLEADLLGAVWALLAVSAALAWAARWWSIVGVRRSVGLPHREKGSGRAGAGAVGMKYLVLAGLAIGVAASERPNLILLAPVMSAWAAWVAWRWVRPEPASLARPAQPDQHVTASGSVASRPDPTASDVPGTSGASSGFESGKSAGAAVAGGGEPIRARRITPAFVSVSLLLSGVLIALAPVVLLSHAASGRWTFLNTSTGINLYIGNNPRAEGTFDEPWSREYPQFTAGNTNLETSSLSMATRLAGRDLTLEEASAFWTRKALEFVRGDPTAFVRVSLRKAALLWNAEEVSNHLTFAFLRKEAPALLAMPIGFGTLAPLAIVGLVLGALVASRRAGASLLALIAAGAAASVLPFFVADRYRAPMVPPLLAAGGAGVAALAGVLLRRGARFNRRIGAAAAAGLVLGALSHLPLIEPDMARGHALLAQAWRAKGNLPAALREYELAVAASGEDGVLLNNLAQVHRAMGMKTEAEEALRRAIRAEPRLSYPHKNLAWLLIERGSVDEALGELRVASGLDPRDPEPPGALAELLAGRGDESEAAAAYTKARRLDPDDPRLARLAEKYPYLEPGRITSPRATP
jgi:tetratricopeptide (TPR) repeat protein